MFNLNYLNMCVQMPYYMYNNNRRIINMAGSKTNRIDLRVDDENKNLLEKAAQLNGLSLSSYITSICIRQAKLDIKQNESLYLSQEDMNLVYELLENAPEPNKALKELFR